jgi:Right handed beta helix region
MHQNRCAFMRAFTVAVVLCAAGPVIAATWHVGGGDGGTLKHILDTAAGGDTILVGPGTYRIFRGFNISKPLHVMSEQGPFVTVIWNFGMSIGVGGPCYGSYGIAAFETGGGFTISGFTIRDNSIGGDVGGYQDMVAGIGIIVEDASGTIRDNIIINSPIMAMELLGDCSVVVERNLIVSNDWGINACGSSSLEIHHNTFVKNGTGVHAPGGSAHAGAIRSNIIVDGESLGIKIDSSSTYAISCNDVWNNGRGNYGGCLTDLTGIDGNISADPLFCDGYHLQQESPCIGSNAPAFCAGTSMGCYAIPCGVGVDRKSWGTIKSLFK